MNKHLNFRLSGQRLHFSEKVVYLGIILDEHLSWNGHITLLIQKLARATGILAKLRHYVNYETLLSVYYALFDSHIGYSFQSWGHVKNEFLDKISKLQNKAIRIIHRKGNRESVQPLYISARILPINRGLKLKNCLLAFDQQRGTTPSYFKDFWKPMGNNHDNFTKSTKIKLEISRTKTVTYGSYNIKNLVASHWNEVLPNLKIDINTVSKQTLKITFMLFYYLILLPRIVAIIS